MIDATKLNQEWQELAPIFKRSFIAADHEFYIAAVDRFFVTIVADETNKHEQPYQTVIEQAFAEQVIDDVLDLVGFFLHISSHHRCDLFWEHCPIPMSQFTPDQLDFVEEVYNQRLVSVVAPEFHSAFPMVNARYDVYKGFNVANRRPMQTMFAPCCNTGNALLDDLHQWLYSSDPLSQQTFNGYIRLWSLLVAEPSVAGLIHQYEQ